MKPIEIRVLLLRSGKTQGQIAKELGITRAFVNQVVLGVRRTGYIREAIAKAVGKPVEKLWPCTTSDARLRPSNHKRKAA